MSELYEVPDIKSELERKTFTELENLVSKRTLNRITNAEYIACINTMFAICSGLIDKDFFELITEAAKDAVPDFSFNRTRLFESRDGQKLTVISKINQPSNDFSVSILSSTNFNKKVLKGKRDETYTNIETEQKLSKFINSLKRSGYKELI